MEKKLWIFCRGCLIKYQSQPHFCRKVNLGKGQCKCSKTFTYIFTLYIVINWYANIHNTTRFSVTWLNHDDVITWWRHFLMTSSLDDVIKLWRHREKFDKNHIFQKLYWSASKNMYQMNIQFNCNLLPKDFDWVAFLCH